MTQSMAARVVTKRGSQRIYRDVARWLLYGLLAFFTVAFAGPFFWTLTTSLKDWWEVYLYPPKLLPQTPMWSNYVDVFERVPFGRWIWNTLVISTLSVIGAVLSSSLVGYGFSRFRFPGRDLMFMLCLATMMLPSEVTLIPTYVVFSKIRWINTWKPLIVPNWFGGGAFNVFLLRQFFLTLPRDLDEAAMMDGSGPLRIFWNVLLPLCVPALMTVTVIGFLDSWRDFMGPLIYINSLEKQVVSVALDWFRFEADRMSGHGGKPSQHLLMAAATITTFPCLMLFIVAQRYFVRGIVMSGLKGAGV